MMPFLEVLFFLALLSQVAIQDTLRPLLDFAGPDAAQRWQAVNDGVMGGVSDGRFRMNPDRTMEFFGRLSLENNGGFASVRTKPTNFNIHAGDTLVVRVKGTAGNMFSTSTRGVARWLFPTAQPCQPRKTSGLR